MTATSLTNRSPCHSLVGYFEALCRAADFWGTTGGMAARSFEGSSAENLERFIRKMFEGLAVAWKGELRCQCHGHAWDQKKFASLKKWLPKDDAMLGIQRQEIPRTPTRKEVNGAKNDKDNAAEDILKMQAMKKNIYAEAKDKEGIKVIVIESDKKIDEENPYHN